MTEAEYRTVPNFEKHPLYDDSDPRCDSIDRPRMGYEVREATELVDALGLSRDSVFEFRGGIRHHGDSGDFTIFAYFWKRSG